MTCVYGGSKKREVHCDLGKRTSDALRNDRLCLMPQRPPVSATRGRKEGCVEEAGEDGEDGHELSSDAHVLGWGEVEQSGSGERRRRRRRRRREATGGGPRKSQELSARRRSAIATANTTVRWCSDRGSKEMRFFEPPTVLSDRRQPP